MHVGALAILELGAFARADGSLDTARFAGYVESRFDELPRCRQRLAFTPVTRHPVWVDDGDFRLDRHIREARLDAPGGDAALARLADSIFSAPLERGRPLWEIVVVQGLADRGRFAAICKFHHAMIDGIAGMDFISQILTFGAREAPDATAAWQPKPAPGAPRLLAGELRHYASAAPRLARALGRLTTDGGSRSRLRERTLALVRFFSSGILGTSRTSLSASPCRERSFRWFATSRADERSVRSRLGGSRDDVALAVATGALRQLLLHAGAKLRRLRVKAMNPVNVRSTGERGDLGNRVSMLIVGLPVAEPDAARRLEAVTATTARLRASNHGLGVDVLAQIDEWLPASLAQRSSMWLATRVRAYNVVVTVIPGPSSHLYALTSRLMALYPLAPVFAGQHINIAALTYLDAVHWGVHYAGADAAEAERLVADLRASFDELVAAAAEASPRIAVVPAAEAAEPEAARRAT